MTAVPILGVPTSGEIRGGVHRLPLRVYYEDTDAGGIVYHANYLRFAERARTEFLRLIGWGHERLAAEHGLGWVVRRLEIDYHRPARLGDALAVVTGLGRLSGARVHVVQRVRRLDDESAGDDLARLALQLVLLTDAGRPAPLPVALRDALHPFQMPQES
jgi:acyl-CoA thioester hydrolase